MDIFFTLLVKLIPLYLIIGCGVIAGKYLRVQKESISPLLIYIIAPAVIFYGTQQADLTPNMLFLPVITFVTACIISIIFFAIGKKIWSDSTSNILGFTAGTGNTGYFGLPVITLVMGNNMLSTVVLATLGFLIFENTLGYYLIARTHYSLSASLLKLAKLPTIYAFIVGLLLNKQAFTLPSGIISVLEQFKGSYTILGMMIIGVGLSHASKLALDGKFILIAFLAKFTVWPLAILSIINFDQHFTHLLTPTIDQVLIILASVPLAANTVTFATELKAQPEKAAITVLLSTLFALLFIPAVVSLFF